MSWKTCLLLACAGLSGCVGTTGSDLVDFDAYAAGPEGADPSQPWTFTTSRGWNVSLTKARLHIGAMYLDSARPTPGSQATSCTLPGLYVASVPGGLDQVDPDTQASYVDVLSGTPQRFAVQGEGTSTHALAAELWLSGADVNAQDDSTEILATEGSASNGSQTLAFKGNLTIGRNRAVPPSDPSMPGANPICKQRIVSPVPVDLTPRAGGALLLRINPE
ncbi:MAG TPA: hypothetical protein VIV60_28605, partial [Polyangiaceae bacterium]